LIIQQLINGLTLGAVYSLLALGYSLVFGVLSFINFAHGAVAMVGAFGAWYGFRRMGLPFLPSCLIGALLAGIAGVVMERVGYKPIRNAPRLAMIAVSVGFAYIVQTGLQIIFGTEPYKFSAGNTVAYNFGNVSFSSIDVSVLAVSCILMIGLQLFVRYTKRGRSLRAVSLDQDTAALMGVNVNSTISLTFFIGSALGGVSAIMMSMYISQVYPTMGIDIGNKAFAAVILGGVGSIPGAMVGGILMGVIESFTGTILNAQVSQGVAFVVLILILIFKPSGLLGKGVIKE
jgi:branched-chain amino acid transport system permease protein